MRKQMPVVAGWIDELREVFGADCINRSIRSGMKGEPTFYASENGQEIGSKGIEARHVVSGSDFMLNTTEHNAKGRHGK